MHAVVDGPAGAAVVVLSPSLGSTVAMWDPQVEALASRFRVVRYDHRGHGRSPVPPGSYEIADLGADLLRLLDRLDVERAHLAGLSLGGMTAMWVAAHAAPRVARLALLCTSPLLGPPAMWADRADTVRRDGMAAIADAVVSRWFTPDWAVEHRKEVEAMRQMVADTPADGYAACCGAIERMDLTPDLSSITAPTIVIAGADDEAAPLPNAEAIVEGIPDARLEVLSPAAHLASFEQSAATTSLLLRHFTEEAR